MMQMRECGASRFWSVVALVVLLPALVSGQATVSSSSAPATETLELWAGHQVVFGTRSIPVIGDLETRADSYVLARVQRTQDGMELVQHACSFGFAEVLGVAIKMDQRVIKNLPPATIRFAVSEQGGLRSQPWTVSWGNEDADHDGAPGMSIQVSSALCSGDIHVANTTRSRAMGQLTNDGMQGSVSVRTIEKVLGATSSCLKLGSKDRDETQHGIFAYRRVASGATCETLLKAGWPVQAKRDGPGKK